jgi:hypothetical protein
MDRLRVELAAYSCRDSRRFERQGARTVFPLPVRSDRFLRVETDNNRLASIQTGAKLNLTGWRCLSCLRTVAPAPETYRKTSRSRWFADVNVPPVQASRSRRQVSYCCRPMATNRWRLAGHHSLLLTRASLRSLVLRPTSATRQACLFGDLVGVPGTAQCDFRATAARRAAGRAYPPDLICRAQPMDQGWRLASSGIVRVCKGPNPVTLLTDNADAIEAQAASPEIIQAWRAADLEACSICQILKFAYGRARGTGATPFLVIAPVPREGLNRECGEDGRSSKSAAVPATVSGERDALAPLVGAATGQGLSGKACIKPRPASQETCRRTGRSCLGPGDGHGTVLSV